MQQMDGSVIIIITFKSSDEGPLFAANGVKKEKPQSYNIGPFQYSSEELDAIFAVRCCLLYS